MEGTGLIAIKQFIDSQNVFPNQGASANVNEEISPEKLVEKQRIVIEELK